MPMTKTQATLIHRVTAWMAGSTEVPVSTAEAYRLAAELADYARGVMGAGTRGDEVRAAAPAARRPVPRTVGTAAELDALPRGTVLLRGAPALTMADVFTRWSDGWHGVGYTDTPFTSAEMAALAGRATHAQFAVIHVPGPA